MALEATQPTNTERRGWNRLALALLVFGLVTLAGASYLIFDSLTGGSNYNGIGDAEAFGPPVALYQTPVPPPTAQPSPTAERSAPLARITIPRFNVDAPVIVLGIDENGVMEAPEDPWDAAWYDFTARPGEGSNAVFSGHVDWTFENGPAGAVFWDLKNLVLGDVISVELVDGASYSYSVISREQVDPNNVDINRIVGPTAEEYITLITCGGQFDPVTGHYPNRTIVRAELMQDAPSAQNAP